MERARRYRYALINVYKPLRGVDDEGWGVETTKYKYSHEQHINYLTTSALMGGNRVLAHDREESWSIWEGIVSALPLIEDLDIITIVGTEGEDEVTFLVRKSLPIGRNRMRLILDERPSFQLVEDED